MGLHTCVYGKATGSFFHSHHLPFPSLPVTGSPSLCHGKYFHAQPRGPHLHAQPRGPCSPNASQFSLQPLLPPHQPPQPSTLLQMLALPLSTSLPTTSPFPPRCHSQPRLAAWLPTTNPSPQSLRLPNVSLLASFLLPHHKASTEAFSYNPPFSQRAECHLPLK